MRLPCIFVTKGMKIMTAKTHLAVGYAVTMAVTRPKSLQELVMCIGITTIGAVISDIDATTSESKKNLTKVIMITLAGIVSIFAADLFLDAGIINKFKNNENIVRLISGFFLFIGICVFGEHQPHRSFMHSAIGVLAISLSFSVMIPSSAKYMAVSMLSHILIDMLNKKKIRILYPLKKPKIGFNICYADGLANRVIFLAAGAAAIVEFLFIAWNIAKGFIK